MARTDQVSAALVRWMDKAFNDSEAPPVGGVSGGTELRPGVSLPALDNFDTCVLAWVMSGIRFRTETFPSPAEIPQCGGRLAVEFTVGIARCSEALGDGGVLPSIETMEREFAIQEDDKDRLWAATCRAAKELEMEHHVRSS
ncbi:hypothetical protein ABEQ89_12350, partial [Cutibacterium acnes]